MTDCEIIVVLCPPLSTGQTIAPGFNHLSAGFATARRLVDEGHRVHLIADGATVRAVQPDWLDSAADLYLSELGEYRLGDPIERSRELAADVRAWLDRTFDAACAPLAAGEVFYASLAGRVLQPLFHAVPFVEGLAAAFPASRFVVSGPAWLGSPLLRNMIGATGGTVEPGETASEAGWVVRFAAAWLLSLARALAGQVVNYAKSRPARRFLGERRSSERPRLDAWVALVPDWQRINQHVVDRIMEPLIAQGEAVGVILITTLASGERTATSAGTAVGGATPWPTIDALPKGREDLVIEQAVRPLSSLRLAASMIKGSLASLRIGWRLLRGGPRFAFGRYPVLLHDFARPLAALATTDVLQVAAVRAAMAEVSQRHRFAGLPVVFSSVGLADTAAADRLLSASGATTINFVHGALGDLWPGQNENCSDIMMVWTKADLDSCRKQGSTGALLPPPAAALTSRQDRQRRNVLFMTSHLHHDWAPAGFPWRPFLYEILGCREIIDSLEPGAFAFRWRPHPSDVASEVAAMHDAFPGLARSGGTSLREDLDWADFVVMGPSTTLLDALDADVPVFIQAVPGMRCLPEIIAADPRRLFFHADDLRGPFAECLPQLTMNPIAALAPERALRSALLSAHSPPADLAEFLHRLGDQALS